MDERILLVDDDEMILRSYQLVLHGQYPQVRTISSGQEALADLAAAGPAAVVVSDMRMPGMDGLEFLSRVRALHPTTVRIMLTGDSDVQTAIDAVNQGNIFRFLCKPCPEGTLRSAIEASLEQYRLIVAEKQLLENTLTESIKVLAEVLGLVNPIAFSKSQRVARYVRSVASKLRPEDSWRFEIAAMLSQLGCITLDPETIEAARKGKPLSNDDLERIANHPAVARQLLGRIPRLEDIAEMIGLQNELRRVAPSSEVVNRVQLGAQILKACNEFDRLIQNGVPAQAATDALQAKSAEYDSAVVSALAALPTELLPSEVVCYLSINNLAHKMVLDQDIKTTSGTLLLSKGTEVTETLLLRLRGFQARGSIEGEVRVLVPLRAARRAQS